MSFERNVGHLGKCSISSEHITILKAFPSSVTGAVPIHDILRANEEIGSKVTQ